MELQNFTYILAQEYDIIRVMIPYKRCIRKTPKNKEFQTNPSLDFAISYVEDHARIIVSGDENKALQGMI